ncbi:MAG: acetyl-CoA carboxylase biotin carboxylase subunit [Candidatus Gastranaerophilaceae bacterium]
MFRKVLVANRGEISVRVIRACRELGIPTVAVYSEADANSLHVRLATDAYCIGPADSSKSYLSIPAIMSVAEISGADAIHPGYGFMSERADFAEICEQHGIKFIGPSAYSMRKMGDKATARKTMIENDVPVIPGTEIVNDAKEIKKFAKRVGYPIILKATAGGGGKGMRIVRTDDEVENNLKLCQTEAEKAFGNPGVYCEKYLENPRHIEVQIIGDQYGHYIYLGERDCSIQRRHQKLIEETPSPAIDERTRKKMGEAAIRAAKAVKYEGVGTCEFLLDSDGKWYFMEMNTRVQVEHCITEMVTQIDIVREQIRVAAGEKLDYKQKDVVLKGHAIECRINAENPEKDFMPCPGLIEGYVAPGGFGVRVDSHVYPGYKIPPYYDSMIGKLICWGENRNQARRRIYQALKEYVIIGVNTTIPFHQSIIEDEVFISGNFNTSFLEDFYTRTGNFQKDKEKQENK